MKKTLNRREFTLAAAMAALSGVAITISACSGGGSGSTTAPTPLGAGDKAGAVDANHGHTAVIPSGQLTAGGALSLNIRGTSDHPHTVTLTATDMTTIAGNGRV